MDFDKTQARHQHGSCQRQYESREPHGHLRVYQYCHRECSLWNARRAKRMYNASSHMQIEVFAADQSITSCWVAQQQLQLQFAFALASNGKHATDEHAQRSTRKVGRESAQKHAKVTV